ncbi:MAG TPA: hypothetical protein VFK69_03705 [Candidatus Eisenbacteria bacterium]|nr:hypothetical protein [Candidatus Eisenbacteria bacterium]
MLYADSAKLAVFVVWEPVTPGDHAVRLPPMGTLARIGDPRAAQYWDPDRALSRRMVAELPKDTLASVAQTGSGAPIAWDCVALFRAGRRWDERFPVPDWAAWPVLDVADTLALRLRAVQRDASATPAR